ERRVMLLLMKEKIENSVEGHIEKFSSGNQVGPKKIRFFRSDSSACSGSCCHSGASGWHFLQCPV
ncbi:hypothetical protein XENOCAPTIV_008523, partial [Xenoophorus captivus]